MEDITVFKDKKKIHKEMLNILNDIHKYIHSQNMINTSNEDIVELINDFNAIYDELKKDEWNNPSDIIFLKKINNVTKSDVKLREYLNKMEYIKIYNILKKELRELFRDKKSLAMMLIIPIFIPLIMLNPIPNSIFNLLLNASNTSDTSIFSCTNKEFF